MIEDSASRGIYILGNDRVFDDVLAFVHSLKKHLPGYHVRLIPYNDDAQLLAPALRRKFGIETFTDTRLFEFLAKHAHAIHGQDIPAFRKLACWFGPFERFIYYDTDMLVFQDPREVFELLDNHDFLYFSHTHGIRYVFAERVMERGLLTEPEIRSLFNSGFFASKRGVLSYEQLNSVLGEAATVSDIFDSFTMDQPILNYVFLKTTARRGDLRSLVPGVPFNAWAGDPTYRIKNGLPCLVDGTPLQDIHWAGFHQITKRPYFNLWLRYRYPSLTELMLRLAVPLWWRLREAGQQFAATSVAHRWLGTHSAEWYKPGFQLSRIRRKATQIRKKREP